jgi:hypothetical protein
MSHWQLYYKATLFDRAREDRMGQVRECIHNGHHIRYVVPTCGALTEITNVFQWLIRIEQGGGG